MSARVIKKHEVDETAATFTTAAVTGISKNQVGRNNDSENNVRSG